MRVIWSDLAIEDLQEIEEYIARDNPERAISFIPINHNIMWREKSTCSYCGIKIPMNYTIIHSGEEGILVPLLFLSEI